RVCRFGGARGRASLRRSRVAGAVGRLSNPRTDHRQGLQAARLARQVRRATMSFSRSSASVQQSNPAGHPDASRGDGVFRFRPTGTGSTPSAGPSGRAPAGQAGLGAGFGGRFAGAGGMMDAKSTVYSDADLRRISESVGGSAGDPTST